MSGKQEFTPGRHRSFVHIVAAGDVAVLIQLGAEEREGVDYELSIDWFDLHPGRSPSPRVSVFYDAWLAFSEVADFFAWLSSKHGDTPSPEDVCEALRSMGFADHTERKDPNQ